MISPKIQERLNAHLNAEQFSSQIYLAMSAHCSSLNFRGMAAWLKVQASEENAHMMKFFDFQLERNGIVDLMPLAAPGNDFGGPIEVFSRVLEHEKAVTRRIHELFELAREEKDYALEVFLHWFISEQVEEEARVSEIVDRLAAVGDKGGAIWYLDKELGKRGR
jgi:ferritin